MVTKRRMILLLTMVFISSGLMFSVAESEAQDHKDWQEDIAFMLNKLQRLHPDSYTRIRGKMFETSVTKLYESLPFLDKADIPIEVAKLLAKVGDVHTSLMLSQQKLDYRRFPLGLYWFNDGLHVTSTIPDYSSALGSRLIEIDNTGVDIIVDKVNSLISHEGPARLKTFNPGYIMIPEILKHEQIIANPEKATFTFLDSSGSTLKLDIKPLSNTGNISRVYYSIPERIVPLYRRDSNLNYWYSYLKEIRLLFFKYNRCAEMDGRPLKEIFSDMLKYIDDKQVDKLIIDLRDNVGGNSALLDPFVNNLTFKSSVNRKGRLFVIIGRRTFSSGVTNAISLRDKTRSILIGEPCDIHRFGNIQDIILPNSQFTVTCSTTISAVANKGEGLSLKPSVNVDLTLSDYYSGIDPVFDEILSF